MEDLILQIMGAMGCLRNNGFTVLESDFNAMDRKLKYYAITDYDYNDECMTLDALDAVGLDAVLRYYRQLCISRGLIRPGELFNLYDIEGMLPRLSRR